MQSMHSYGARCAKPSTGSSRAPVKYSRPTHQPVAKRFATLLVMALTAFVISGCSSGDGGDNGSANPRDEITPQGLAFTYPFNGQQDVLLDTQMVVNFAGDVSGSMDDALELQVDGETAQPALRVEQDTDQSNILRLIPGGDLLPNTTYAVVATRTISGGNTRFNDGQTLLQFTTRPIDGRPADGAFEVVETTPGETNPVTGRTTIFTQFNTIRVRLNEPVDPASVNAQTFTVTDANGDSVDNARITAQGRYLVFDPVEDLAPGSYTIALSSDITSAFGKSLASYSVNRAVLSAGEMVTQNLELEPSAEDVDDLPANDLNGLAINNINIASPLLGSNDQPASVSPQRSTVQTILAEPGLEGFDDVIPATIRAGQKIQLTGLRLALNGDITTPINPSGPIDVNFINDVDVYLMSNDYRNIETPTAVRLRFDLGIGTLITAVAGQPGSQAFSQFVVQSLANGVFNQSALNIQAAGLAVPQPNGDLKIATVGTFPINVNLTDKATVDVALTLTLPNKPLDDQTPLDNDVIAPIVTAQSPSACLYVFGSPAYNASYTSASPIAFPEQVCNQVLAGGGLTPPFINSFPVESSPAITFSEPLDPASVNAGSVTLASSTGTVDASYRVEGFSVVIDPTETLQPGTNYTIRLNSSDMLTDLAGNAVTFENAFGPGQLIAFTTEPSVDSSPAAPLLGTLTPGIPCALEGGDFRSGGDNAGHCVGDMPGQDDEGNDLASNDFPVFENPANVAVDGFFSKLVASDSLVLADGCLTSGSGDGNSDNNATIAVQRMDGSGQCLGAVPGELALSNRDGGLTRGFSFRPTQPFEAGSRYWIVVCGADGNSCSNQIVDADGAALNTDPLNGTGSTPQSQAQSTTSGTDIVIPFDAIAATEAYYTNQFTLPESDTNGNGQFDDGEIAQGGNRTLINLTATAPTGAVIPVNGEQPDGRFASYLSLARPIAIRDTLDDCSVLSAVQNENGDNAIGSTPDECIQVSLLPGGVNSLTSLNISTDALAMVITQALGIDQITGLLDQLLNGSADGMSMGDMDAMDGGNPLTGALNQVVGGVTNILGPLLGDGAGAGDDQLPADVIAQLQMNPTTAPLGNLLVGLLSSDTPVSALPGLLDNLVDGLISTVTAGLVGDEPLQTGRVLLRFPNEDNVTQSGYIVEKCEGTNNGQPYDFEPCFAASLTLIANAPDGQGVTLNQQPIQVNLVGPVTFEQNGRLAIALNNVNTFQLNATALNLLPATATVMPGALNFQLVGSPTHGGREFPAP